MLVMNQEYKIYLLNNLCTTYYFCYIIPYNLGEIDN